MKTPRHPQTQSQKEKRDKRESDLATAIGRVCIRWGRLEHELCWFIEALAPLKEGDISRAVTNEMDIRAKIQTIKALAYIRKPSDEWLNKMLILLDYIDNDLRVRRNRFVHDGWYHHAHGLFRVTNRSKLLKPQAFQLILKTEERSLARVSDVIKLNKELDSLVFIMFAFWYDYTHPQYVRPLPARLWHQFLRRAKPGAHPTYVNSMRQHPPLAPRQKQS
ncbi:hypothetical protein [Methylosinus sporium]|uniref:hypothetical protein n=1 Tax=Methylosinus sporium TaxID=428 RepID=UPI00383B43B2